VTLMRVGGPPDNSKGCGATREAGNGEMSLAVAGGVGGGVGGLAGDQSRRAGGSELARAVHLSFCLNQEHARSGLAGKSGCVSRVAAIVSIAAAIVPGAVADADAEVSVAAAIVSVAAAIVSIAIADADAIVSAAAAIVSVAVSDAIVSVADAIVSVAVEELEAGSIDGV